LDNLPAIAKPSNNVGQGLTAYTPRRTWREALAKVENHTYYLPADARIPADTPENQIRQMCCAMAQTLDTPEMHASVSPESKQALSCIIRDIAEGVEEPQDAVNKAARRIATLIEYDGVPIDVVFNEIGRSLVGKIECCDDLLDARETVEWALLFEPDKNELAYPVYERDEFGRMAEYILKQSPSLTATSERQFYNDNRPIPVSIVNAHIDAVLTNCRLWDRHRNEPCSVDNRLINEVRSAMARKLIRSGRVPRQQPNVSSVNAVIDHLPAIPAVVASNPMHQFAAERLELDRGSWTSSDKLWASWEDWCSSVGQAPGIRAVFFKELRSWGGECITSAKRRTAGKLVHGYRGFG